MKNDNPKSTSDALARTDFATRVSDVIKNLSREDEGFTISIEARWGEGKTWLLEQIRTKLINHCVAVQFNPWLVGSRDKLLQELFGEISHEIGKPESQLIELVPFLSKLIKAAARVSATASPEASFIGRCASKALAWIRGPSLVTAKTILANKLRLSTRKIVVFIDDIDRLHPSEAVEVLRLIKAVGELPNVVYVIAIDPDYLVQAIEAAQYPNATTYLDKIIQLRLTLPPLRHVQKAKIMDHEVEMRLQSNPFIRAPGGEAACKAQWQALGQSICRSCESIRDIKRIWNRFDFVAPGCISEINPIDLLALQVIYITAPNLYQQIELTPQWFLKGSPPGEAVGIAQASTGLGGQNQQAELDRVEKEGRERIEKLITRYSQAVRAALLDLITELFPNVFSPSLKDADKQYGLIANERNLIVSLNAGMVSEQWRTSEIDLFIADKNRDDLISRCTTKELLDELLDELSARKKDIGKCLNPIDLLLRICDLSITLNDFETMFNSPAQLIRLWLRTLQKEDSNAATRMASELGNALLLSAGRLFFLGAAFEDEFDALGSDEPKITKLRRLDPAVMMALRHQLCEKIITFLDSGQLLNLPRATTFFSRLAIDEPFTFASIASSFERFEQWALIDSKTPDSTSETRKVLFVLSEHVTLLQQNTNLLSHITQLDKKYAGDPVMALWLTAFRNPDVHYDMATGKITTKF